MLWRVQCTSPSTNLLAVVLAAIAVASCGGSTGGDSVTGVSVDHAAETAVLSSPPLDAVVEEADSYGEGEILPSDLVWDPVLDAAFPPNPDGTITESCKKHKVKICHKGKRTIRVSRRALKKHLRHGDTRGECPSSGASCPCFSGSDINNAATACAGASGTLDLSCMTGNPYSLGMACVYPGTTPPDTNFYVSQTGGTNQCLRSDVYGVVSQDGLSEAEYQACVDVINASGYCS